MVNVSISLIKAHELLGQQRPKSVDLIVADPPYGTGLTGSKVPDYTLSKAMAAKNWENFKAAWDVIPEYRKFTVEWMAAALEALSDKGTLLVWGTLQHNIHHIRQAVDDLGAWTVQGLYWTKTNNMPNLSGTQFSCATEILCVIRRKKKKGNYYDKTVAARYPLPGKDGQPLKNLRDYFLYPAETWVGADWEHPSRKPVKLTSLLIDAYARKGTAEPITIIDPFAGSGTTGVSAQEVPGLHANVLLGDADRGYMRNILARRLFPTSYQLAPYAGPELLELPITRMEVREYA
jgi:DNA modification methylase